MKQTLTEILAPTFTKVVLAITFAVFWHYYLLEQAVRQTAEGSLIGAREFWVTNFVNSLPYFETDNTFLKFLTFFVTAYVLIWLASRVLQVLDRLQDILVKKFRRQG